MFPVCKSLLVVTRRYNGYVSTCNVTSSWKTVIVSRIEKTRFAIGEEKSDLVHTQITDGTGIRRSNRRSFPSTKKKVGYQIDSISRCFFRRVWSSVPSGVQRRDDVSISIIYNIYEILLYTSTRSKLPWDRYRDNRKSSIILLTQLQRMRVPEGNVIYTRNKFYSWILFLKHQNLKLIRDACDYSIY